MPLPIMRVHYLLLLPEKKCDTRITIAAIECNPHHPHGPRGKRITSPGAKVQLHRVKDMIGRDQQISNKYRIEFVEVDGDTMRIDCTFVGRIVSNQ